MNVRAGPGTGTLKTGAGWLSAPGEIHRGWGRVAVSIKRWTGTRQGENHTMHRHTHSCDAIEYLHMSHTVHMNASANLGGKACSIYCTHPTKRKACPGGSARMGMPVWRQNSGNGSPQQSAKDVCMCMCMCMRSQLRGLASDGWRAGCSC
jgi:hypothetical protein